MLVNIFSEAGYIKNLLNQQKFAPTSRFPISDIPSVAFLVPSLVSYPQALTQISLLLL